MISPPDYILSSIGVGLPNIDTETLRRRFFFINFFYQDRVNEAKGPSQTLTCSPISKLTLGSGAKDPSLILPKILSISLC